ncbi:m-AAA protease-interacting protein 1, mitochondrial-like [Littorina saxatilis]|uniref:Tim44-like domain-containing protein n=1 Tax=Littorina saxatilis TaxID=31220 RepID=A0AAN9B6R4_9CAEN
MAACAVASKLQRHRILASTVLASDTMLNRSLELCSHHVSAFRQCATASHAQPRTLCPVLTKRKLARSNVAKPSFPLNELAAAGEQESHLLTKNMKFVSVCKRAVAGYSNLLGSLDIKSCTGGTAAALGCSCKPGIYQQSGGVMGNPVTKVQTVNTAALCLPRTLHQLQVHGQSTRGFSSRPGSERQEVDEEDEEERKRRLRGAVMYITNPVSWVTNKWNTAKLKRMLDPSFSEDEFLFGAKQAICHVTQMVSKGKFFELNGLALDEVIEWMRTYRTSLSDQELEALSLDVDDIVLIKNRYIQLDLEEDKQDVFIDAACFGLKVSESVPYLVDMGIRFKRDYSSNPPGSWVVAGVTHIRLQNLAPE